MQWSKQLKCRGVRLSAPAGNMLREAVEVGELQWRGRGGEARYDFGEARNAGGKYMAVTVNVKFAKAKCRGINILGVSLL